MNALKYDLKPFDFGVQGQWIERPKEFTDTKRRENSIDM